MTKDERREYHKRWYESQKANNSTYLKDRQRKNNRQKEERARKKKVLFIKEFGGKCSICGYEYNGKNAAAFDFHHLDPSEKDYSPANIIRHSVAKAREELSKCQLVCSNCHRLIHAEFEY